MPRPTLHLDGRNMLIDRRAFIRSGAAAGAVLSLSGYGCTPAAVPDGGDDGSSTGLVSPFDLEEISISEIRERLTSGELTGRAITEMYLGRIEALITNGPRLHAVLETNPDALQIADELDQELQAQGPRGPLHGIPILLKDNIDTADRMTTTVGSTALLDRFHLRIPSLPPSCARPVRCCWVKPT